MRDHRSILQLPGHVRLTRRPVVVVPIVIGREVLVHRRLRVPLRRPGAGTEVTLDVRCWGTGFLWKMLAPLIGILMKRTDSQQLIKLRKMIEGDDGGR